MRNAETILTTIVERGQKGLHLERVYRLLFNRDLYLKAYGRLYSNDGAMTRGITDETVDGMSLEKIDAIIDLIRHERYRWTPVRRTEIPKANGKTRPLGIPTWSDKLVQEVIRSILEAFFEPQFAATSHGFRPDRGCHTALAEIDKTWTGTKWFIEGDIKGCFDNIDHQVLLSILRETIHDGRFLHLIEGLLQAGYMENWRYNRTLSGTPQGGIVSPLLANIYLDRLDKYVSGTLIPEFTKGKKRKMSAEYLRVYHRMRGLKAAGKIAEFKELREVLQTIPGIEYHDPNYRRLNYIRYADDFLLGFVGTREEAGTIKDRLNDFLRDHLKLTLSPEKTLIGHAVDDSARFLGYEVSVKRSVSRPAANGFISLRIPIDKLKGYLDRYRKKGKPSHRVGLIDNTDFSIVQQFGAELRGIAQYYLRAENACWLNHLQYVMRISLLKTLARKHKTTKLKMARQYRVINQPGQLVAVVQREGQPPLRAVFGETPLKMNKRATLPDRDPKFRIFSNDRTEILQRLLAETCECCGSQDKLQVHHIRRISDLKTRGQVTPAWKQVMASRYRKTLVTCQECHRRIHAGLETRRPPK